MNVLQKPAAVSPEAWAAAQAGIDDLWAVDRLLAVLAVSDALNVDVVDPKRQSKVDQEIAKANEALERGDLRAAAGAFDEAIKDYKKAWKHAVGQRHHRGY